MPAYQLHLGLSRPYSLAEFTLGSEKRLLLLRPIMDREIAVTSFPEFPGVTTRIIDTNRMFYWLHASKLLIFLQKCSDFNEVELLLVHRGTT